MKLITVITTLIIIISTIFINVEYRMQQEIKVDSNNNDQSFDYDLNEDVKITFIKWTNKYNKIFSHQEFEMRFEIFKDNKQFVEQHNSNKNSTMVLGLNEFAHYTHNEFLGMFTSLSFSKIGFSYTSEGEKVPFVFNDLPESVDWTYTTPTVHNQGICGCTYAFAAASALENVAYKENGKPINLSVQQILDCTREFGNNGCGVGYDYNCFKFVKQNGGIVSSDDLPYTGIVGSCPSHSNFTKYAHITGWVKVNEQDKFTEALATVGVISASINASPRSFGMYQSGVYDDPTCGKSGYTSITVSTVGYGIENGIPFYKIKNSWGQSWGMGGFMKLKRDICLIANYGVYPILTE